MKGKIAILTLALCAAPAMAQGGLQKATGEEVLEASLSAVNGQENTYPMDVIESTDAETGDTVQTYTFTGPSDEVNEIIAQCQIRLEQEIGYDRSTGIVRAVAENVPVCGDQYTSMRDMITIDEVTASFAVREYVYQ